MSKLYVVIIPGGRAGEHMSTLTINLKDLDLDNAETIESILEGEYSDYNSLTPNRSSDIPPMVEVMKGNKEMFIEWDVFGEGVVGITTVKSLRDKLAKKTRDYFGDVDDNPKWDD